MATARTIINIVARYRGIPARQLGSFSRERRYAWPRQEASWLIRRHTDLSLPVIGRLMGGRDHTTIFAGCRAVDERCRTIEGYQDDLQRMSDLIALSDTTRQSAQVCQEIRIG